MGRERDRDCGGDRGIGRDRNRGIENDRNRDSDRGRGRDRSRGRGRGSNMWRERVQGRLYKHGGVGGGRGTLMARPDYLLHT